MRDSQTLNSPIIKRYNTPKTTNDLLTVARSSPHPAINWEQNLSVVLLRKWALDFTCSDRPHLNGSERMQESRLTALRHTADMVENVMVPSTSTPMPFHQSMFFTPLQSYIECLLSSQKWARKEPCPRPLPSSPDLDRHALHLVGDILITGDLVASRIAIQLVAADCNLLHT